MGGYYTIGEDAVKLKARGGAAYTAKICEIKFRAERDEQICIIFDKYDVKDRVNLMIYDDKKSSGNPMVFIQCSEHPMFPVHHVYRGKLCSLLE